MCRSVISLFYIYVYKYSPSFFSPSLSSSPYLFLHPPNLLPSSLTPFLLAYAQTLGSEEGDEGEATESTRLMPPANRHKLVAEFFGGLADMRSNAIERVLSWLIATVKARLITPKDVLDG